MFDLEKYIRELTTSLKRIFGERLLYVGLQGSYLRNEADENSDVDIMVIIDNITVKDLDEYRKAIISVGYFEKSCGFICGKSEMANWNPLEVCHLIHTTKNIHGNLTEFLPMYTEEDEKNFIKYSVGNIYHEICHRYIHSDRDKNIINLPFTYKSLFYLLQNLYYLEHGIFIATKRELNEHLSNEDKEVMELAMKLKENIDYDFDYAFGKLFTWCQKVLSRV
jgi:uncharacterized protein